MNLKKAHLRILLQTGQEVKQLSSRHELERGRAGARGAGGVLGGAAGVLPVRDSLTGVAITGRLAWASLHPSQAEGKGP